MMILMVIKMMMVVAIRGNVRDGDFEGGWKCGGAICHGGVRWRHRIEEGKDGGEEEEEEEEEAGGTKDAWGKKGSDSKRSG